ncbi:MAG TPA: hypothetical protein VFI28_13495 [Candidatus Limnocylindrales bacterium]|nr:hypothetical protein [Candidatus Limnocylindrales bacterium]
MRGYVRGARRLGRDRYAVMALAVLAILAALAAETSTTARVTLASDIDANWRGAYDILVRPKGARLPLESTDGLVEPNFLSFAGTGGLSADDVAAIGHLPGVDIAAPVSVVGYLSYAPSTPLLCLPELPEQPSLFGLSYSVTVDDGVRSLILQHRSGRLFVGPDDATLTHFRNWYSSLGDVSAGASSSGRVEGDMFLGYLPPISSPLIAVDPSAEAALLGANGSFLQPLAGLADRDQLTTATFDIRLIPKELAIATGDLAGSVVERPVVPIVVSRDIYARLKLHLDVSRIGSPLASYPDLTEATLSEKRIRVEAAVGQGVTPVGGVDLDLAGQIRPYLPPPAVLVWPGKSPGPGECLNQTEVRTPRLDSLLLAGRPTYTAGSSGGDNPSFVVTPLGYVPAVGTWASPQSARDASESQEMAYRPAAVHPLAVAQSFTSTDPSDQPFRLAPVGLFDPLAVDLGFNPLSYVPLGAYVPPVTVVERDDAVPSATGMNLRPGLNPAGFITVPPLAVTDLSAARLLRGVRPVDAVRVRVASVDRYDAAGQQEVSRVAAAIVELGYDVDVVAGASPERVTIRLPRYHTELASAPDLAAVSEHWTTLGAATRVSTVFGTLNSALGALSIVTGVGFAVALEVGRAARRRRDFVILETAGWSTPGITGWYLRESVVAATLVALIGIGLWSVGPRSAPGLGLVFALALSQPVLAVLALLVLARRARLATPASAQVSIRTVRRLPGSGSGPVGYGLRAVVSRPIPGLLMILSCAIGLASFVVASMGAVAAAASAGPTLLGVAESTRLAPYQLLQLTTIAVANTVLFLSLWLGEWRSRSSEVRVLMASGWSDGQIRLAVLSGAVLLSAFVAPVAAGLANELLQWIGWHAPPLAIFIIVVGLLAMLLAAASMLVRPTAEAHER